EARGAVGKARKPALRRQRRILAVLAGEQAVGQRREGDVAHGVPAHRRDGLALVAARDETVLVLAGDEAVEPCSRGGAPRSVDLRGAAVGAAREADLAVAPEILERTQRLLDRRLRVRIVELVEVDPVGPEALQARLGRGFDVGTAGAGAAVLRADPLH